MIHDLLRQEVQQFITENTAKDSAAMALAKNPFPDIDYKVLLSQIDSRSKSKHKLPLWFATQSIIYPEKVAIEQTSSEITARYKSELVSGEALIDLTGGFGVDSYFFSQKIQTVWHCEINPSLSEIVAHNAFLLKANNIVCKQGDSATILKNSKRKFDWIYVDPSRRHDSKGKVFMLNDCLPDVTQLLDFYFDFSDAILIKTAPLLDITLGLSSLKYVKEIHVVALDNEVKELLWVIEKNYCGEVVVKTINFQKGNRIQFDFTLQKKAHIDYGIPNKYLYEPNAAIMKAGGYDYITNKFPVQKLHPHSHLFTASERIDFPGRIFEILEVVVYSKHNAKKLLEKQKMNVSTRNFPETAAALVKKWNIKDGGEHYTFFTTDINEVKIMLLCAKLN